MAFGVVSDRQNPVDINIFGLLFAIMPPDLV